MAVQADYFISGIFKLKEKKTHFFVHKNMAAGFVRGSIKSEKEVIKLLESKYTLLTLTWDYESAKWIDGTEVKVVEINGEKTVRSFKDHRESNHLDKLINMASIMAPPALFFM